MAKPHNDHAQKHLEKRNIPDSKVTQKVADALDAFSEEELKRVDALGAALMDDGMLDDKQKISAVH